MADEKKDEKNTDDSAEQAEGVDEEKESGGGAGLTSPEGILMLCVAGILDGIGLILLLLSWIGIDDYGILDILGAVIIGGWMLFRAGDIKGAGKVAQKGLKRFGFAFLVELTPFLGSACPSWIILVYKELKDG